MGNDGCSGGVSWSWRTFLGRPPPWEGCCDVHDEMYRLGGSRELRLAVDCMLYHCVRKGGHPGMALVMWTAVRTFGGPAWNRPWRWGFGTDNTGYTEDDYG